MSLPSWERGLKLPRLHRMYVYIVAPLVGAWIETDFVKCFEQLFLSLPSWERGLKLCMCISVQVYMCVAPLVGAWIETFIYYIYYTIYIVAPLVGAWIETTSDLEQFVKKKSLPSWERGLKLLKPLHLLQVLLVAPLVGAWIETIVI